MLQSKSCPLCNIVKGRLRDFFFFNQRIYKVSSFYKPLPIFCKLSGCQEACGCNNPSQRKVGGAQSQRATSHKAVKQTPVQDFTAMMCVRAGSHTDFPTQRCYHIICFKSIFASFIRSLLNTHFGNY